MASNIIGQLGMYLTTPSIVQITGASLSLFVAIFSIIQLRAPITAKKWIAMSLMFSGFYIVAASSKDTEYGSNNVLGIILTIISQVFLALALVIEEKLLKYSKINEYFEVGLVGSISAIFTGISLPISSVIKCKYYCRYDYLDDYKEGFTHLANSNFLISSSITLAISFLIYEVSGVVISKYSSSLSRTMYDCSSTLLIWTVSLIVKWETFNIFELIGFCIIVCGASIHNNEKSSELFGGSVRESVVSVEVYKSIEKS